jgi:hypothetical protein
LLIEKIEVPMLLYTLTKRFMDVQRNILNAFGIILFYKVMWWFDGQDVGVDLRRPIFNPPYQHIPFGVCIFIYKPYTCV